MADPPLAEIQAALRLARGPSLKRKRPPLGGWSRVIGSKVLKYWEY